MVLPDAWEPSAPGWLSSWVYELLGGHQGWGAEIASLLLLVAQAAIINGIVLEHRLGEEQNLFPGMFYVLLCSILPGMMHLSPALMANTFLLIALNEIFSVYKNSAAAGSIFNIGFWIAVASLFAPAYIVFLLPAFMGLNILRGLEIKERLMLLTGAIVPFLLGGVWFYWHDQLEQGIAHQFAKRFAWMSFKEAEAFPVWASAAVLGFVVVLALVSYAAMIYKKTIQVQKKIGLLYWMLLAGGLTVPIQPDVQTDQWMAVTIPCGILFGFVFTTLSRRWAESLHLMLFAGVLILQYKQFFLP